MLKTCGTTRLLSAVDPILELAALNEHVKLFPSSVRFTRSTYLFPEEQCEHPRFIRGRVRISREQVWPLGVKLELCHGFKL